MFAAPGLALKAFAVFGTVVGLSAYLAVAYVDVQTPAAAEAGIQAEPELQEMELTEETIAYAGCRDIEIDPSERIGLPDEPEPEVLPEPKPVLLKLSGK
jgi:hypothetical protein